MKLLFEMLIAGVLAVVLLLFGMGCTLEIVQQDPGPSDMDHVMAALDHVVALIEDD